MLTILEVMQDVTKLVFSTVWFVLNSLAHTVEKLKRGFKIIV